MQFYWEGTFLQTLPHLVTALKGHKLSPRRGQRPPKGWILIRLWKQPSARHARNMRRIHPGLKRSSVSIQTILVWFELDGKQHGNIKQTSDIIWVVCNKLTTVWAPTKKLLVSWQFSGTHGVKVNTAVVEVWARNRLLLSGGVHQGSISFKWMVGVPRNWLGRYLYRAFSTVRAFRAGYAQMSTNKPECQIS